MSAFESRDLNDHTSALLVTIQELREQSLHGRQAYDVGHVPFGPSDDEGNWLPLDAAGVRRTCSATPTSNILRKAAAKTDLEGDMRKGGTRLDTSM